MLKDIKNIILKFAFEKCSICKNIKHGSNLDLKNVCKKCSLKFKKKYKSIVYYDSNEYYNLLCYDNRLF